MRTAAVLIMVTAGIISTIVGCFVYRWFDDLLINRPQNTISVEGPVEIKISNPPREVVVEPPPPEPPMPEPLPELPELDGLTVVRVTAVDDSGIPATFDVIILSQEFSWTFARSDRIEKPSGAEADMGEFLQSPGLQTYLSGSRDLIAVGTASCEGEPATEKDRAGSRAAQLIIWMRENLPNHVTERGLLQLNLGRFKRDCSDAEPAETVDQRRVILVSVIKKGPGVTVEGALRNALDTEEALKLRPRHYSVFDLRPAM